jgi:hypothetical protein
MPNVTPPSYPAPGTTITAAYLHSLVDDLEISDFSTSDFNDLGAGAAYGGTAGNAYLRQTTPDETQGLEAWRMPVSTVSLAGYGYRQLLGKVDLAFYSNSNSHVPYKGMPCFVPGYPDDAKQDWSGYTAYRVTDWWIVPRISLDQLHWFKFHSYLVAPSVDYADALHVGEVRAVVEEDGPSDGLVKICQYGYCDALVHATHSNELSLPGTVYALRYGFDDNSMLPVAMNFTDNSAYTSTHVPLGLVRQVYTASGVTLLPFVREDAVADASSNAPYYVARIFLGGGFPCL